MRFEELLAFEAEAVGGFLERDEDAGLDGENWMEAGAATHGHTIVVMTTNVKRKEWSGQHKRRLSILTDDCENLGGRMDKPGLA
jgi:hypothetical protein